MEWINPVILILELAMWLILVRNLSIRHPMVIFFLIVLFYNQAFYLDYLFLQGPADILMFRGVIIRLFSWEYLQFNLAYMLFLCALFTGTILGKQVKDPSIRWIRQEIGNPVLYVLFIGLATIFLCYEIYEYWGLDRYERGQFSSPLRVIVHNVVVFAWILITLNFRKGFSYLIFTIVLLGYFVISFEREPLVLLSLVLFYHYRKQLSAIALALYSVVLLVVLNFWKPFYIYFLYRGGSGFSGFSGHLERNDFSFAFIEPASSIMLLYDYFRQNIYGDYMLSYGSNVLGQLNRMLFESEYQSLAEYASSHYAHGTFGLAFSMILESMINFWWLGPALLGLFIALTWKLILTFSARYGPGITVLFLFICIKWIRTEFATLLKLQAVPAIIAVILIILIIGKTQFNTKHAEG